MHYFSVFFVVVVVFVLLLLTDRARAFVIHRLPSQWRHKTKGTGNGEEAKQNKSRQHPKVNRYTLL